MHTMEVIEEEIELVEGGDLSYLDFELMFPYKVPETSSSIKRKLNKSLTLLHEKSISRTAAEVLEDNFENFVKMKRSAKDEVLVNYVKSESRPIIYR